jgi:HK97 gp10 family phage protein
MSDSIDVKLTGADELVRSIKELAVGSPTAIRNGVLRVAAKIERDAKANVPVNFGRLRASITHNWTGSGIERTSPSEPCTNKENPTKTNDGVGQPQSRGKDAFAAVIGTNVEYAPYVENLETAHHEVGGPHFLYNAYFKNEKDVQKEISSELGKELAKAMRK